MGTLQVGGTTLGVKNSGTGKIDLSNVGDNSLPASAGASLVYLAKYTADSSVETTYFNLSSYTTFTTYKLIFENLLPDADDKILHIRVGTSTSALTSGYSSQQLTWKGPLSGLTDGHSTHPDVLFYLGSAIGIASGEHGVCGEAFITAPLSSSYFTCGSSGTIFAKEDGNHYRHFNSGYYTTAVSTPYIFLSTSSGKDINSGNIIIYGVRNA